MDWTAYDEKMATRRRVLTWLRNSEQTDYFTTFSDRGSVQIDAGDGPELIPNGYGDGVTRVFICREKEFNSDVYYGFDLVKIISAETPVKIYDNDCEVFYNDIARDLPADTWQIYCGGYNNKGTVIFKKW